ncbi:hypothetical protein MMC20_006361 [Loxospora ochrophaea]|nr:hypothetical protein [Loxospora ochrophaea]
MGYSFPTAQGALPQSLKPSGITVPSKRTSGLPRSAVISNPRHDLADIIEILKSDPPPPRAQTSASHTLAEIIEEYRNNPSLSKDLPQPLRQDLANITKELKVNRPPSEDHSNPSDLDSKRSRHSFDVFFGSKYISRQLRQLLLSRSESAASRMQDTRRVLPKDVLIQETVGTGTHPGGEKYLKIVLNPLHIPLDIRDSMNTSTYCVNSLRETTGGILRAAEWSRPPKEAETPSLQQISRSRDATRDAMPQSPILAGDLGIAKDFPHLVSNDANTKIPHPHEPTSRTCAYTSTKSPLQHDSRTNVHGYASRSSNGRRKPPTTLARHTSPVSDLSNIRTETRNGNLRVWNEAPQAVSEKQNEHPVQRPALPVGFERQKSPTITIPKDPRPEPSPSRIPTLSNLDGQSVHSSKPSTAVSLAEGVSSDTSSGIIMSAQSVETTRVSSASYCDANPRKPPKPGPAPTRALPSLPEGLDSSDTMKRLSAGSSKGASRAKTSSPTSVTSVPSRSPARSYNSAPANMINRQDELSRKSPVFQGVFQSSTSPNHMKGSSSRSSDGALSWGMTNEDLTKWRTRRVQSTKVLKKRDWERTRARGGSSPLENTTEDDSDERSDVIILPSIEGVSKFQPVSARNLSHHREKQACSATSEPQGEWWQQARNLASVMVVVDEKPVAINDPGNAVSAGEGPGQVQSHLSQDSLHSVPASQQPSSNSSHGVSSDAASSLNAHQDTHQKRFSEVRPQTVDSQPLSPGTSYNTTEFEARIEARFLAFERRTMLLEAALLAVISTSATLGTSPRNSYGDRSSGTNSLYAPLDSKLEGMLSSLGGNGAGNTQGVGRRPTEL